MDVCFLQKCTFLQQLLTMDGEKQVHVEYMYHNHLKNSNVQ